MKRLEGKTAVVTGAGRGIGYAIARQFAQEGAKVVVIARHAASCEAAAANINAETEGSCEAIACDVADAAAVDACVKEILAKYPVVDILVNNAGITRDGLSMRMKDEDWNAVLDTNLRSAFLFVRALQRTLMKSPAGRVINMSSIVGIRGNAGQANYAASKAGLIGFTKAVAQELARRRVTCNAIAPGFIATEMTEAMPEKAREAVLASIPMGDMGQPDDIANCALFLASDEARYITGHVLVCDGGMCM